jgi:GTP-binding protein LepA
VVDGKIRTGSRIRFLATGQDYEVQETGNFVLSRQKSPSLDSGQVGYLVSGAKQIRDLRVGDTVVDAGKDFPEALPGYKEVKPMVFSGLYPLDADSYEMLREALQKLQLNDSAIRYEPESSTALGFGFRVGFLGLLHMEIVQERLEREFSLGIIATLPNVEYQVSHKDGSELLVSNPAQMPEAGEISEIREPYVRSTVYTPADYVGPLMKLCMERRGIQEGMNYLDGKRVELHFRLPLSEVVVDFYDRLKNISRGHASFDYEYSGHEASELVKLVILINGSPVDALSAIVHRDQAHFWGDRLARKLKEQIPRQLFQVAIQASIGSRVVARCNVSALRKNVTAKCYGGDITRKRKLLERQKEGKRRMKQVGNVEIPQEAFLAVLKVER